jgi:hypothetical protein
MRTAKYDFDQTLWAMPGVGIDYDQAEEVKEEISSLKSLYPEISTWDDLALFSAWGSYSQDHFDIPWNTVVARDESFLAYLYYLEQGNDIMRWNSEMAKGMIAQIF